METLSLGNITLMWLNGGVTFLDGGAMFGVVPKPLWSKKYPCNEKNQIELRTDPIYLEMEGKKILIETGIGKGKLTEKQLRNYGVQEESKLKESLAEISITPDEIDYILMTHLHFDHASGLTERQGNKFTSVFPNAKIITSAIEWNEMREPNVRSKNTYWVENWQAIQHQVEPFENEWNIGNLKMIHTGGHSDGHSIIMIETEQERLIHMADIMPTHAHQNVLWVMAYDDYPMDSIRQKEKWMKAGNEKPTWYTFYHDAYYRAVKWDENGEVLESVKRDAQL